MADLGIKIKAILASAKDSDLDNQIKQLSNEIKERLELKLRIDASDLEVLEKKAKEAKKKVGDALGSPTNGTQFRTDFDFDKEFAKQKRYIDSLGNVKSMVTELITEEQKRLAVHRELNEETGNMDITGFVETDNPEQRAKLEKKVNDEISIQINLLRNRIKLLKENNKNGDFSKIDKFANSLTSKGLDANNYKTQIANWNNEFNVLANNVKKAHKEQTKLITDAEKASRIYFNLGKVVEGIDARNINSRDDLRDWAKLQFPNADEVAVTGQWKEVQKQIGDVNSTLLQTSLRYKITGEDGKEYWQNVGVVLNKTNGELRVFDGTQKDVLNRQLTLGKMIETAYQKFGIWSMVMTSYHIITNKINEAIEYVKELDKALTNIRMVTGGTAEETKKLVGEYTEMAKTLGATTLEVTKSANEWLRQGYSIEETNSLIEASMVLSKVGMIESGKSTEYLTSAIKGYKLEAKDAIGIIDKLSSLDMVSATSAGDLAEAMSRTANSADMAGVSMDKLLSYLAVVSEVTQRSASSVGESFKTIFARMGNIKIGKFVDDETGESLSDVESTLGKVGIKLRDTSDHFRNFGDVLDEVGSKWNTLTDIEKSAISIAIAGTRQRENFLVLMNNYQNALKYTSVAMESNGSAMKKFAVYQESIEAKTKRLTANFETLATRVVNSGLIKGMIDLGNALLNIANSDFGKFIGSVTALTLALLALRLSAIGLGKIFTSFGDSLVVTAVKMALLSSTGKGLMATLAGLSKELWGLMLESPLAMITAVSVAVVGAVKVVDALTVSYGEQIDKMEEASKSYRQYEDDLNNTIQKLDETNKKISELKLKLQNGGLTFVEQEQLNMLEKQNKTLNAQIQILQLKKKLAEETANKEAVKTAEKFDDKYLKDTIADGHDAISQVDYLISQYKEISQEREKLSSEGLFNQSQVSKYEKLGEKLSKISSELTNIAEEADNTATNITKSDAKSTKWKSTLEKVRDNILGLFNVDSSNLSNGIENFSNQVDDASGKATAFGKELQNIESGVSDVATAYQEMSENGEISLSTMIKLISSSEDWVSKITILNGHIKINKDLLVQSAKDVVKAEIDKAKASVLSANARVQSAQRVVEAIESEMKAMDAESYMLGKEGHTGNAYRKLREAQQDAINNSDKINMLQKIYDGMNSADPFKLFNKGNDKKKDKKDKNKYEPSSEQKALKTLLDAKKITLEQYYNRLLALELKTYRGYFKKSSSQLESELRSKNEKIAKKAEEYLALRGEINSTGINVLNKFNEDTQKNIKAIDNQLALLGSVDTVEEKTKEAELLAEKYRVVSKVLEKINSLLSSGKYTGESLEILNNQKLELQKSLVTMQDQTNEVVRQSIELEKQNALIQAQLRYNRKLEELESDIYNGSTQKEYEKQANARISGYQAEIDSMNEKADAEKESVEREKKQVELQKLRIELQNVLNNKNTRILRRKNDGSWEYDYVADPEKVESLNEDIQEKTKEFNDWEDEITRKHNIKQLQDKIKYEQDLIKSKQDLLNENKKILEDTLKSEKDSIELYYLDINTLVSERMTELNTLYSNKWDTIIKTVRTKLAELSELNKSLQAEQLKNNEIQKKVQENPKPTTPKNNTKVIALAPTKKYATGGETENTGWHWLDGKKGLPERVLSAEQTISFNKFVSHLPSFMKMFDITKQIVPNVSRLALNDINTDNTPTQTFQISKIEFPNVTSADGIEEAILNLPRVALQYTK